MIGRSGRTLALTLSGVLALTGAVGAQDEAVDPAAEELTLSAPISVLVAEQLGDDPEAIFRFVADHVRYEPYSGLLRGPGTTFFGRAGNSVDQSLLLARLLAALDIDTRLAVGAIDDATADRLLEATILDTAALDEQRTAAWSSQLPGFQEAPEVPSVASYLPGYDGGSETEAADAWMLEQTVETLALIATAASEAGITLPDATSTLPDDERETHTWVQADIDGTWVDLDPSLPGLAFGEALAEADETLTEVPAERTHLLEVAVVAETLEDGVLTEERILEATLPAHEVADEPIVIAHVGPEADPALAQRFEAVLGLTSRHPIVAIGDDVVAGDDIGFADPEAADGGGLGGGFFDASSSLAETTAEWIDLTIVSPGVEPIAVRRTIFDRVPAEARAAGEISVEALRPQDQIDLDGDGTVELAPDLAVSWLTVATGHPSPIAGVLDLSDEDQRLLSIVPWTQQMITHLAEGSTLRPLGVDAFVDAPNLTALVASARVDETGELVAETAIDIWHRSHGVLPILGADITATPAAIPGIAANVAERMVGGSGLGTPPPDGSVNVAQVFETAVADGQTIAAINDITAVESLPYTESAKATLRRALDDGWVAIAPERPVELGGAERVGWWLVDPATGRVADQMDNGMGVETIEWMGIQWTRAEVVALQAIGAILTAVLAYRGAKLYYDPPKMKEPGQGFKAVQEFFGW